MNDKGGERREGRERETEKKIFGGEIIFKLKRVKLEKNY